MLKQQADPTKRPSALSRASWRWAEEILSSEKAGPSDSLGELAEMVERSLSMREVAGSMPAFSTGMFLVFIHCAVLKNISNLYRYARKTKCKKKRVNCNVKRFTYYFQYFIFTFQAGKLFCYIQEEKSPYTK